MISEEFKQNVASGNPDMVRSTLIDYLIIDRTFKSFDEAFGYANNFMGIIEPFNNEPPFSEEPWNRTYLNQQKVALMMNFSLERITHIKKVISNVLPVQQEEPRFNEQKTISTSRTGSKTGRSVVSETTLPKQEQQKASASRPSSVRQEKPKSTTHSTEHTTTGNRKTTGSRIVRETVSLPKRTEDKEKSDTDIIGTALIVGGVAVAAVGLATVEPIIIGTGVVIAGVGVTVKAKKGR
ncbi:MAG: hypothetical protein WAT96_06560 [Streptococcus suis]